MSAGERKNQDINPFQLGASFHMETSHLIIAANQMTDFYIKCSLNSTLRKKFNSKSHVPRNL